MSESLPATIVAKDQRRARVESLGSLQMSISATMGQGLGNECFALVFSHSGEVDVFVPSTSAKRIFFYSVCTGPKVAFKRGN